MDDGSLCLSHRINHLKKKIYITPQIYLYLQNYQHEQLIELQQHIKETFNITLKIGKRKDGFGSILRTTSVKETFAYLDLIQNVTSTCPTMFYKTNWKHRLEVETAKYESNHPGYSVITSHHKRFKNYTSEELRKMIKLKESDYTDQFIADQLERSYWSIVYKLSELRKEGLIK